MRAATLLVFLSGCTAWTDAQLGLVEQARRGVDHLTDANAAAAEVAASDLLRQREVLDTAFELDVREAVLTPEWVETHRRAYAAGLDALHEKRLSTRLAAEADRRNAEATRRALDDLGWLLRLQRRAQLLLPLIGDHHDDAP